MKASIALSAALLITPLINAQSPLSSADSGPDASTITLKQDVHNVILDVIVTDKHGNPIHSLDKNHFKVMENGISQDISFLEEHSAAQ